MLDPDEHPIQQCIALLVRHGARDLAEEVAATPHDSPGESYAEPDHWLTDTEEVRLADRTLQVLATPGHTAEHVVFHDADQGLLFAGDHVLPSITPSIGFEPQLRPLPLADFLTSLQRMLDLPDALLLPAHGAWGGSVHERARELLDFHEERLAQILLVVRAGEANAWEIAVQVPWTRHGHRLATMSQFNRMLAVLETAHHLRVLEERGLTRMQRSGEVLTFRALD